jgi:hypothetical protein
MKVEMPNLSSKCQSLTNMPSDWGVEKDKFGRIVAVIVPTPEGGWNKEIAIEMQQNLPPSGTYGSWYHIRSRVVRALSQTRLTGKEYRAPRKNTDPTTSITSYSYPGSPD